MPSFCRTSQALPSSFRKRSKRTESSSSSCSVRLQPCFRHYDWLREIKCLFVCLIQASRNVRIHENCFEKTCLRWCIYIPTNKIFFSNFFKTISKNHTVLLDLMGPIDNRTTNRTALVPHLVRQAWPMTIIIASDFDQTVHVVNRLCTLVTSLILYDN